MTDRVPYIPGAVCPNCGFKYRYLDELDSHDLHCPGPITLVFTDDGIYGEVGSE